MKTGTRVHIEGASFRSGVVSAVLPKTSDKIDERFAVPFPQTERRELYVIIAPDAGNADVASAPGTAGGPPACMVGQWVTVTRDNGVVPSMSVTWREIGNLLTSWSGHDDGQTASAAATPHAGILQAGLAKLQSVLRLSSAHLTPKLKGQWLP